MKTPAEVLALLEGRLDRYWPHSLVLEAAPQAESDTPAWPYAVPLGRPSGKELTADFGTFAERVYSWRAWARIHHIPLRETTRRVNGTSQVLLTHVEIDSIDTAARLAGGGWDGVLQTGRQRLADILAAFPHTRALPSVLRAVSALSDLDFRILLAVAAWFSQHRGTYEGQLTPRQVPIEGVHAKWLNKHKGLVCSLTRIEDLGLLPPHPPRIHFTYLDPGYLAAGGRKHDSLSIGDNLHLPYTPAVVLISENKDTAIGFPPVTGGIAIEGEGRGASTIASIAWVKSAQHVFYWGDMDQDGLEILNEYRTAGLSIRSLFMTPSAYDRYQHLGTNHDVRGDPITIHAPRPVKELDSAETTLYQLLASGGPVRRIEQERIPLPTAQASLCAAMAGDTTTSPTNPI